MVVNIKKNAPGVQIPSLALFSPDKDLNIE
jgi:hypothetical protein